MPARLRSWRLVQDILLVFVTLYINRVNMLNRVFLEGRIVTKSEAKNVDAQYRKIAAKRTVAVANTAAISNYFQISHSRSGITLDLRSLNPRFPLRFQSPHAIRLRR